jgi:hypothetical protein
MMKGRYGSTKLLSVQNCSAFSVAESSHGHGCLQLQMSQHCNTCTVLKHAPQKWQEADDVICHVWVTIRSVLHCACCKTSCCVVHEHSLSCTPFFWHCAEKSCLAVTCGNCHIHIPKIPSQLCYRDLSVPGPLFSKLNLGPFIKRYEMERS